MVYRIIARCKNFIMTVKSVYQYRGCYMPKENSSNKLRLVETEEVVICLKCNRKNQKDIDRCAECGFPLKDTILTRVIPIEFLTQGR